MSRIPFLSLSLLFLSSLGVQAQEKPQDPLFAYRDSVCSAFNEVYFASMHDDLLSTDSVFRSFIEPADLRAEAILTWNMNTAAHVITTLGLEKLMARFPEELRQNALWPFVQEAYESECSCESGGQVSDFAARTPEGEEIRLSEFVRGKKIVLLDFWASWCHPCREKSPRIKALYQKYHDQGFDVIAFSIDTDKTKWQNAIDKDGLPWTNVSELKYKDSPICKAYHLNGVPTLYFLDENLNILASGYNVAQNMELILRDFFEKCNP